MGPQEHMHDRGNRKAHGSSNEVRGMASAAPAQCGRQAQQAANEPSSSTCSRFFWRDSKSNTCGVRTCSVWI